MKEALKNTKRFVRRSTYLPLIVVLVVVVLIGFFAVKATLDQTPPVLADKKVTIEKPNAQQTLNKVIYFSVKDGEGKEVTKVRYEILNAELRDQIVVKGQKASAIKGRTFLVLNVKITNDYDKPMQINARDYIRLIINGSKEKLAPEIHNDPVEVQAISTKYTRLGFAINDSDQNLVLQIGEVGGKKETIKLNLK